MVYGITVNLDICNVCRPSYIEQFLILRQCIIEYVIVNVMISYVQWSQQSVYVTVQVEKEENSRDTVFVALAGGHTDAVWLSQLFCWFEKFEN